MPNVLDTQFFGGIPELIVPDNLRTGIASAHPYEPELNRTYEDMTRHYGTAVVPARVRKPKDKTYASYCTSFTALDGSGGSHRFSVMFFARILAGEFSGIGS